MAQGLGTQLRHLIELLDNAVQRSYEEAALPDYRPRYTPVMRVLSTRQHVTIGEIAELAGITQPAATQTVALMQSQGLLLIEAGTQDARQRIVRLSAKGAALLPHLAQCWRATQSAADSLDAELDLPLSHILAQALEALAARPFGARIESARQALQLKAKKAARPPAAKNPPAAAAPPQPRKKKTA